MLDNCDICKYGEQSVLLEPCASCWDYSNFEDNVMRIDWIERYAEKHTGFRHTAIIQMLEDWKKEYDKDK